MNEELTQEFVEFIARTPSQYDETSRALADEVLVLRAENAKLDAERATAAAKANELPGMSAALDEFRWIVDIIREAVADHDATTAKLAYEQRHAPLADRVRAALATLPSVQLRNETKELHEENAKLRAKLAAQQKAAGDYFEHWSAEHENDECPQDDTCECPLVQAINAAFAESEDV